MQGVQVNLWYPLTMRAIPERLRDVSCIGATQIDITFAKGKINKLEILLYDQSRSGFVIGGNWDAWLCSTTTCRPTCDAYVSRLTYCTYWSTYRLLSNHNIATTLLAKQTKADENTNSVVDVTAAVTTTHNRQLRYVPVKCELMNRNEDPKMWKHTATAPFVLIPEGPGRVVTVASSTTDIHNMSCTAVSNKTFPFMDLTLLVQRQVRHLSLSLSLSPF